MKRFVVGIWSLVATSHFVGQFCGAGYDDAIQRIQREASRLQGDQERLVLVGSSSFRFWPQTDTVFAQYEVVNAGFGGSCFADLWRLREDLIYALQPDVLLVYEGDNDLFDGVPEHLILNTASRLLQELAQKLPSTRVVVVAPKASRARYHLSESYLTLNENLKSLVVANGATWVDFWSAQHKANGALRDDLFLADQLHLNPTGYAVWVQSLREQVAWLDPNKVDGN